MKKRFIALTMLLSMLLILSSVSSVFATVDKDNAYGYTIKVYAGRHGHFTKAPEGGKLSDNGKTITISKDSGTSVTIDPTTTGLVVDDGEYYARGFREAGHDNDEQMANANINPVDEDISYEVAYGIKGGMVKYTVMYVDANGDSLVDSNEYYGMVGDKPVVSYHYIDGYQPNAYNLTKTLVADESQNIFAFSYLSNPEGTADNGDAGNTQAGARNAANGQNNANANANANAGTNDANANAPATIVDLDDNATPQAENAGGTTDIEDTDAPKAGISPIAIGGGLIALAAIAAAAIAIVKRRNAEYEDDDEDDEE